MRDTHMQECERKMLPYVSFVNTSLKSQLHQAGQAKRAKVGFFCLFCKEFPLVEKQNPALACNLQSINVFIKLQKTYFTTFFFNVPEYNLSYRFNTEYINPLLEFSI